MQKKILFYDTNPMGKVPQSRLIGEIKDNIISQVDIDYIKDDIKSKCQPKSKVSIISKSYSSNSMQTRNSSSSKQFRTQQNSTNKFIKNIVRLQG